MQDMKSLLFLLGFALLSSAVEAEAQAAAEKCDDTDLITSRVIIPLDDTGIGDWRFVNPRSPYPLLRSKKGYGVRPAAEECWNLDKSRQERLRDVEIRFENQTSNRSFTVDLLFEIAPPWAKVLETLQALRFVSESEKRKNLRPLRGDCQLGDVATSTEAGQGNEAPQEAVRDSQSPPSLPKDSEGEVSSLEAAQEKAEQAEAKLQDRYRHGSRKEIETAQQAKRAAEEKLEKARKDQRSDEAAKLQVILSSLGEEKRGGLEAELLMSSGREQVGVVTAWLEENDSVRGATACHRSFDDAVEDCMKAVSDLGSIALAGETDRNAIETACRLVGFVCRDKPADLAWAAAAFERFDRALVHAFEVQDHVDRGLGDQDLAKRCEKKGGKLRCQSSLSLGINQLAEIEGELVAALPKGLATFNVSFEGEAEIPTNAKGYLQTAAVWDEPASTTSWMLSASVGYTRDPELPGEDEEGNDLNVTLEEPHQGEELRRLPGAASIKLKQSLGARAEGSATMEFKSGNLGESDQSNEVKVSNYQVRIFGRNGTELRFGKYKFLSSIGANPVGEGLEWHWRGLSIGEILERESLEGTANDADQDARTFIFQARNLALPRDLGARLDIFGLWGEDEKPDNAQEFWTAGLRAYMALPKIREDWSPTLEAQWFRSETRRGEAARDSVRDGRGNSWLFSARLADVVDGEEVRKERTRNGHEEPKGGWRLRLGETLWSAVAVVGHGSGDDPQTPDRNEGYLGKTASFKPDKVFISRLAPEIRDEHGGLFPGLTNKLYAGVSLETRAFTPIQVFWRWLNSDERIFGRSAKVSYHYYRFDEPVFGEREIGSEIDLDFSIQAPKSVTTSVGVGWFSPGRAVKDLFPKTPWVLELKVAIDFK